MFGRKAVNSILLLLNHGAPVGSRLMGRDLAGSSTLTVSTELEVGVDEIPGGRMLSEKETKRGSDIQGSQVWRSKPGERRPRAEEKGI